MGITQVQAILIQIGARWIITIDTVAIPITIIALKIESNIDH